MNHLSIPRTLLAGIAATVAMTVLTMVAPMMGMPKMDIPAMLAGFMNAPVIVGWLAHFMIGIILAFIYAGFFYSKLPGCGYVQGMIFSLFPWLMAQLLVMPMMMVAMGMPFSSGLFSGSFIMAMGSLMGHLVYGLVLGLIYRVQEDYEAEPQYK